MRIRPLILPLLSLGIAGSLWSAPDPARSLSALCDPALEGRRTGTPGGVAAAQWLAGELRALGAPELDGFVDGRRGFVFHPATTATGRWLRLVGGPEFASPADWQPLAASSAAAVRGSVVFCGYGLQAPEAGWADYQPADVAGRVALLARTIPDGLSVGTAHATSLGERVNHLRRAGAVAVLVADSPFDAQAGRLRGEGPDPSLGDAGLPVAGVSAALADSLLAPSGSTLKGLLSRITRARQPQPATLVRAEVELAVQVDRPAAQGWNLGLALPGTGAAARRWVLVGAHFDHLGRGADGGAPVHPGADDNASGVSLLLALAGDLRTGLPDLPDGRRSLALVWFDGEEQGRLGSRSLLADGPAWLDSLDLMVNLDMVGRLGGAGLQVLGGADQPELSARLEQAAARGGFTAKACAESPGGDHESFLARGVPSLMLFTGIHDDYHKPSDTPDKLDPAGMGRLRQALGEWLPVLLDPALRPRPVTPGARPAAPEGSPVRVAMGITPGYEGRDGGLPVLAVKEGSAAERAGLRAGDVLLLLGRFPVANIHDYTFALRHYAAGDELPVAWLRDGLRMQGAVRLEERVRP
jgi:aminopeptidase YwaD